MMGADKGVIKREDLHPDATIIYIGSHGDSGAAMADIVLPGAAYTEKSGTFCNTEGRAQRTTKAINPPGHAREDWKIIRAISEIADTTLPYDDVYSLRSKMGRVAPALLREGDREENNYVEEYNSLLEKVTTETVSNTPLDAPINKLKDFYQTDAISRASQTMANCVKACDELV